MTLIHLISSSGKRISFQAAIQLEKNVRSQQWECRLMHFGGSFDGSEEMVYEGILFVGVADMEDHFGNQLIMLQELIEQGIIEISAYEDGDPVEVYWHFIDLPDLPLPINIGDFFNEENLSTVLAEFIGHILGDKISKVEK